MAGTGTVSCVIVCEKCLYDKIRPAAAVLNITLFSHVCKS